MNKPYLSDRDKKVVELRESGKTFMEISNIVGISGNFAKAICDKAKRMEEDSRCGFLPLPIRLRNLLHRNHINDVNELKNALNNGKLKRMNGIGNKSYQRIKELVGGDE